MRSLTAALRRTESKNLPGSAFAPENFEIKGLHDSG